MTGLEEVYTAGRSAPRRGNGRRSLLVDLRSRLGRPRPHLRPMDVAAGVAFLGQLIALGALAFWVYHRFNLSLDFAHYHEAAHQIAEGDLYPRSTIFGYPFLDGHFELLIYPVALLYLVVRTAFLLSFLQVLATVLSGAVAWKWASEMLADRQVPARARALIELGILAILVLSAPAASNAAADFHFEPAATLFALCTARALWKGSNRAAVGWAVLLLMTGDIGGLYLVGVGFSALLVGRPNRRGALAFLATGVLWIGLIGMLHANRGSNVQDYAYLAGRAVLPTGFGGAALIVVGMIAHPGRWYGLIRGRLHFAGRWLAFGGFAGIATPWGFGVPAVVLATSALQRTELFIGFPFQQVPVIPFVAFGTAWLLGSLVLLGKRGHFKWGAGFGVLSRPDRPRPEHSRRRHSRGRPATAAPGSAAVRTGAPAVAVVLGVLAVANALYFDFRDTRAEIRQNPEAGFIQAGQAATLRRVLARVPSSAEVIASLSVSGRLAGRKYIYLFDAPGTAIPLRAETVVMVLDTVHTPQLTTSDQAAAAVAHVTRDFGARPLGSGPGVVAVIWHRRGPPAKVVLP